MALELSRGDARRLALRAQLLTAARPTDLLETVRALPLRARDAVASEYRDANFMVRTDMPPAYFSRRLALSDIDGPVELSAYDNVARLIGDIEHQLQQMPALIEAKLKDQLALVNGLDLIGEVERLKLRSMEAGRAAFLQDEAERRDAAAAFAATAR